MRNTPSRRVRDAIGLFVGLEVNVRAAFLDCIEQYFVDELDDRRIIDIAVVLVLDFVAARDFETFEVEVVIGQILHRGVDRFERPPDVVLQLFLLDHDGVDAETRCKFDLVHRGQIGRIRDSQEQSFAAQHQRKYAMLLNQVSLNGFDDVHIHLEGVEIEERYAELM